MMDKVEQELMEKQIDNTEIENIDCTLPDVVRNEVIENQIEEYVAGVSRDAPADVVKEAASRLNLGLLYENISLLLNVKRQKRKIDLLEKQIYTENGINASKEIVSLYNAENSLYMQQVEYVRKYVLNNKSALDDLNADVNELVKLLYQLSTPQIKRIKDMIKDMISEETINVDDVMEDGEGV